MLSGFADVRVQADTTTRAKQMVLDAANGDPDDEDGDRRYTLPDGARFRLDEEDEVTGGDIWVEVIIDDRTIETAASSKQVVSQHMRLLPTELPAGSIRHDIAGMVVETIQQQDRRFS